MTQIDRDRYIFLFTKKKIHQKTFLNLWFSKSCIRLTIRRESFYFLFEFRILRNSDSVGLGWAPQSEFFLPPFSFLSLQLWWYRSTGHYLRISAQNGKLLGTFKTYYDMNLHGSCLRFLSDRAWPVPKLLEASLLHSFHHLTLFLDPYLLTGSAWILDIALHCIGAQLTFF